jgi:hypothetical protein
MTSQMELILWSYNSIFSSEKQKKMQHSLYSSVSRPSQPRKYREKDPQLALEPLHNSHHLKVKVKDHCGANHNDSLDTCESDRSVQRESLPKACRLKVELCKNYLAKGYCPYEARCRFAHGVEELRARDTAQSAELYRTRKCNVFFERGQCRFG